MEASYTERYGGKQRAVQRKVSETYQDVCLGKLICLYPLEKIIWIQLVINFMLLSSVV